MNVEHSEQEVNQQNGSSQSAEVTAPATASEESAMHIHLLKTLLDFEAAADQDDELRFISRQSPFTSDQR